MAEPSLKGCRLKVGRAKQHLKRLEGEMSSFIDDAYEVTGNFQPDGPDSGWQTIDVVATAAPPQEWGVLVGDFVHNLSSALDHLVWELRLINGGQRASRSGFPAFNNRHSFAGEAGEAMLKGVSGEARALIERQQPYRRWDRARFHPLAVIRRLSNEDKHRFIHGAVAWWGKPDEQTKLLVTYEGRMDADESPLISEGQPLEEKTNLMRFRLVDCPRMPPYVKVESKLPIDIAFGKPNFPIQATTLDTLSEYVELTLNLSERFFPGRLTTKGLV